MTSEKKGGGLNLSRQHDIFRPEQAACPVTIIGAGGIGSPTALLLAKMGVPDITVLDYDTVEEHNRPSQFFRREDLGRPKVEALADQCESHADARITARNERYVDQSLAGLVIVAVDSMDVRKEVWDRGVKWNPNVELYVDARMGGQVARILTARPYEPAEVERYERYLYPSSAASQEPCTARAIVYTTFGIASLIAATVRRWWVHGAADAEHTFDFDSLTFI